MFLAILLTLLVAPLLIVRLRTENADHENYQSALDRFPVTRNARAVPYSDILPDDRCPKLQTHLAKVRGVLFKNRDGSDRQEVIRQFCNPGDALALVREPDNPFDSNAIAVIRAVYGLDGEPTRGEQLGYVPSELAKSLANRLDTMSFAAGEIEGVLAERYGVIGMYAGLSISIYEHQRFERTNP